MKKFLHIFLFVFLISVLMAISSYAAEIVDSDNNNITWKVNLHENGGNNTATITGANIKATTTSFNIPSTLEYEGKTYVVTEIAEGAFNGNKSVSGPLTLPSQLVTIGKNAFRSSNISGDLIIPETVTNIGETAFYDCKTLKSVTIPKSPSDDFVITFGNAVFQSCPALLKVTIEGNVTQISTNAFQNCGKLQEVIIGDGVKIIGNTAFQNCPYLVTVTIGNNVTTINNNAFQNCYALENLNLGDGLTTISASAFNNCRSLKIVKLGKNITSIGNTAFQNCHGLKELIIDGDKPLTIGESAFQYCTALISVTLGDNVEVLNNNVFQYCYYMEKIHIGKGIKTIGSNAFQNCYRLANVYITDVAAWCNISFSNQYSNPLFPYEYNTNNKILYSLAHKLYLNGELLTDLVIPEGVTKLNNYAFYGCTSIVSATIPSSLTSIGNYAFHNCFNLTTVTIGSDVTSIGTEAFRYCDKLVEVYNLSKINIVAKNTSNGYVGYRAIHLYNAASEEEKRVFVTNDGYVFYDDGENRYLLAYVGGKTNITLPESCNGEPYEIYQYAFYCNKEILNVVMPNGITGIGENAFQHSNICGNIIIPDTVITLGKSIFKNCFGIISVTFPESITEIPESMFQFDSNDRKSALKTVIFKGTVTKFNNNCFNRCYSLNEIVISEDTLYIGQNAFYLCLALEGNTNKSNGKLNLPKLTTLASQAFYGCTSITDVSLGTLNFSVDAFRTCTSLKSITVSEDNTSYKSIDGVLFSKDMTILYLYPSAKEGELFIISDSVTEIAAYAFYGTSNLKKVKIGSSVNKVGDNAFQRSGIESMYFPQNVVTIGSNVCANTPNLKWVVLDKGVTSTCSGLVSGASSIERVISKGRQLDSGCGFQTPDFVTPSYNCKDHLYGYLDDDATCEIDGTAICVICSAQEKLQALGHIGKIIGSSSLTCSTDQYKLVECSRCNQSVKIDVIESTGHKRGNLVFQDINANGLTYLFYQCTVCNETVMENFGAYIVGDINRDGRIDQNDIKLLGEYIGGKSVTVNKFACDVNGDGVVDIADLITLRAFVMNMDITLTNEKFSCENHIHRKSITLIERSCTENGVDLTYCTDCGLILDQQIYDATGHLYIQKPNTIMVQPSCTTNGSYFGYCEYCGDEATVSIPATGHTGKWWTLDEKGFEYRKCYVCHALESHEVDYSVIDRIMTQFSPYYELYYTTESAQLVRPILENYEKALTQVQLDALVADAENVLTRITYKTEKIPVVYLETTKKLSRNEYTWANIMVAYNDANGYNLVANYDGSIKIRGNATNNATKYPFNIKFNHDIDLLGMGKGKKYCLLANLYDKTILRNALAMEFAASLGLNYAPKYKFVDLYIDGKYNGVYLLTTPADVVGEDRADLDEETDFLLKLFPRDKRSNYDNFIVSPIYGIDCVVEQPSELTAESYAELYSTISKIDYAIQSGDWEEIQKYIDVEDLARYFVFHEVIKDLDILWDSTKFCIRNGKLCSGPVWDFDYSLGNMNIPASLEKGNDGYDNGSLAAYYNIPGSRSNGIAGNSATGTWADCLWANERAMGNYKERPNWFSVLYKNSPEFRDLVRDTYLSAETQEKITILYEDRIGYYGLEQRNTIDLMVDERYGGFYAYFQKDYAKYGGGNYGSGYVEGSVDYTTCVERLRDWIKERNEWLIEYYSSLK